MMSKRCVLMVAITVVVIACSPGSLMVRQMTAMIDNGISAFERDSDLALVEKSIPGNIKLLEAMQVNAPDDDRLAAVIARLYGSYGFGFVETRLEEMLYSARADAC